MAQEPSALKPKRAPRGLTGIESFYVGAALAGSFCWAEGGTSQEVASQIVLSSIGMLSVLGLIRLVFRPIYVFPENDPGMAANGRNCITLWFVGRVQWVASLWTWLFRWPLKDIEPMSDEDREGWDSPQNPSRETIEPCGCEVYQECSRCRGRVT